MPALPLDTAGKYVAAAYLVFLGVILIYVAIMAARLGRVERDITELDNLLKVKEEAEAGQTGTFPPSGATGEPVTDGGSETKS